MGKPVAVSTPDSQPAEGETGQSGTEVQLAAVCRQATSAYHGSRSERGRRRTSESESESE